MTLQSLSTTTIALDGSISSKSPQKVSIDAPLKDKRVGEAFRFEDEAISFLYTERSVLGIQKVYRLKNALIDCYVLTDEGMGVAVEFKLALNWNKSNVARSQIINFSHERIFEKLELPEPRLGIILFQHFSGDWARVEGGRTEANGWYRFYQEQRGYEELMKIHILQLDNDRVFNPGWT